MKYFVYPLILLVFLFSTGAINGKPKYGLDRGYKFNLVVVPKAEDEKSDAKVYLKYGKDKKVKKVYLTN